MGTEQAAAEVDGGMLTRQGSFVEELKILRNPGKGLGGSLDSRGGYRRPGAATMPYEGSGGGTLATRREEYQQATFETWWCLAIVLSFSLCAGFGLHYLRIYC